MFKNYLKIALRIFWQNKTYVGVNLAGLGFALTCCILSYLNYNYRAAFDSNHKNVENIYRVNTQRKINDATQPWGSTPGPIGNAMISDIAAIDRMARLYSENVIIKKGENVISEELYITDKTLFSFFHFPLLSGTYEGLDNRNNVLLSESLASKYFGEEQAIGKQLVLLKDGKSEIFTVTGVLAKMPKNSSFQFDIITSFNNAFVNQENDLTDWRQAPFLTTFIEVKNKQSAVGVSGMLDKYVTTQNQARKDWIIEKFYLQPFREIALSSDIDFASYVHGSNLNSNPRGVTVYVPAIMSLFILIIACFNFTNISIAFASRRLKEIGIRKVLGGRKIELIKQFLVENIVLCLIASGLAAGLTLSLLPLLNQQSGMELQFNVVKSPALLLFILLLPFAAAIVAGLYPSFYISSFEPIGILKGNTKFGPKSPFTRVLLFFQFSISCLALIIGIAMTKNASYQDKADFGYAINELAVAEVSSEAEYNALSNMLRNNPDILGVGGAAQQIGVNTLPVKASAAASEVTAQLAGVGGEEYMKAMNIRLLQGRHFYNGKLEEENSIIVNSTLVSQLNLKEPVGAQLKVDSIYYTIIGVVADYKEFGLHGKIPPCILRATSVDDFRYLVIRANESRLPDVQKAIKNAWPKVSSDKPYSGFLQSQVFEKERYMNAGLQSVSIFLAIVIIALSASGLFALVSLNIIRRSKEVGIRKVLGASILYLMRLISSDFLLIITIAFALGSLFAYVVLDKIIFSFIYAYHADLSIDIFIYTLGIVMLSCCLTIGWKVYFAASRTPINVLRKD